MRIAVAVLALLLFLPACVHADDPRDVNKVNKLLDDFKTPQLAPGGRGVVHFVFKNRNDHTMRNVHLSANIYLFATQEGVEKVDESNKWPYFSNNNMRNFTFPSFEINSSDSKLFNLTVVTTQNTRRGTIFSQGAYFVRFWLEFEYNTSGEGATNLTHYVMASRGYFSNEEWDYATNKTVLENCTFPKGEVCLSVLGVDGILPDTSFGVKEPIPMWPFYLILALIVLFALLAFMFYLEEHPGTWPWMEVRWRRFRGIITQQTAFLRRKRRPKS